MLHDPNLASADFGVFLEELSRDVIQASGIKGVECIVNTSGVDIPAHKFIPLALIVTELLSNSLEHAFADAATEPSASPAASTASPAKSHSPSMMTARPAAEFQPANNKKPRPLHRQSLAEQIDGRLSMASSRGTQCTLYFPASA